MKCVFCDIVRGSASAAMVFEDEHSVAFLDAKPLFRGHTLLVPREHHDTLVDVPSGLITPLFATAQRLAQAVEQSMNAQGTFVAINNRVSQSVPHLHIHVVPRTKGDGLKGFFWPRTKYRSDEEMQQTAAAIRAAIT